MPRKQRLDLVEKSLQTVGWNYSVAEELAKLTGASIRTIYRDKDLVVEHLAKWEASGIDARRNAMLTDLRRLRAKAEAAKDFGPAARLASMEARMLGLDLPPLPAPSPADLALTVDTSIESLLGDVRRMRRAAQAGHSHVAAFKLLEQEHELVRDIQARDKAKRDADMDGEPEDKIVAELANELRS